MQHDLEMMDFHDEFTRPNLQQLDNEITTAMDKLKHILQDMRTDLDPITDGAVILALGVVGIFAFASGFVVGCTAAYIYSKSGDNDGDGQWDLSDNDDDGDGSLDQYDRYPNNPTLKCFPPIFLPELMARRQDSLVPGRFANRFIANGRPIIPTFEIRILRADRRVMRVWK